MTTALPPAYQPTSETDALSAAHQILGDLGHAFTGDWHQALEDAVTEWTTPAPTAPPAV